VTSIVGAPCLYGVTGHTTGRCRESSVTYSQVIIRSKHSLTSGGRLLVTPET
jgi:hypothetical protein